MLHSSNIRMTAVMLPRIWLSKICFNFCICFISPVKNGSVTFTLSENIIIMHDTLSPLVLILQASVYLMFRLTLVSFSSPQSSTIYSLVDFLGKAHANNTLWILTCWSLLCPLYLKISFVGCKILGTFFSPYFKYKGWTTQSWGLDPPHSRKFRYNLYLVLHIHSSFISTVSHLQIQRTTDGVVL